MGVRECVSVSEMVCGTVIKRLNETNLTSSNRSAIYAIEGKEKSINSNMNKKCGNKSLLERSNSTYFVKSESSLSLSLSLSE